MFFIQIIEAFLVRTEPDSSMVNPAHIHITSAPQIRNEKVLSMNVTSPPVIRASILRTTCLRLKNYVPQGTIRGLKSVADYT